MGNLPEVRFLGGACWPDRYPREQLPEVAFVGRSNVGKSSLINVLVGRKGIARTSKTPGKTQVIHFYRVNNQFILVDLPGYGYARVSDEIKRRWRPMVERYMTTREALRLVVLLLDFRRTPSPLDLQIRTWLDHRAKSYIIVVTKVDKLPRGKRRQQMGRIAEDLGFPVEELIPFSALTREGHRQIWGRIRKAIEEAKPRS